MKATNGAYKKGGWDAVAKLPGMTATYIASLHKTMHIGLTPDKVPFPAYRMSNLGATIRGVKERIEKLERETVRESMAPIVGHGWRIEERPDLNRIAVQFDKKPPQAVRDLLRGWNYSPIENASLRLNNPAARAHARYFADKLAALYPTAAG